MSTPQRTTGDEYRAFVEEIETAVRRATDRLAPGMQRADVAITTAVRLLAEQPERALRLGQELPERDPSARIELESAVGVCAALLQEQLGDALEQAQARGIVTTLLALAINDLQRPGDADPATIITASTTLLRGIVPARARS